MSRGTEFQIETIQYAKNFEPFADKHAHGKNTVRNYTLQL